MNTAERQQPRDDATSPRDQEPGSRHRLGGRARRFAVPLAGGLLVAFVGFTAVTIAVGNDGADGPLDGDRNLLTRYGAIACAKQIVVGQAATVTAGEEDGTLDVTITVDEWVKPARGPSTIELSGIVVPETIGQPSWEVGARRLLFVPQPGDLRFTPAEVSQTGMGTNGGSTLEAGLRAVRSELEQGLRTPCPSVS